MKTKYLLITLVVLVTACSDKDNKSDAYGTFEANEIIVSAQATGEIFYLNINEGDLLKENEIIGLIDTVNLSLKKQQVAAQRDAAGASILVTLSQIKVQEQQKKNILVEKQRVEKLLKDAAATPKQMDDINGALNLIEKQIEATKTKNKSVFDQIEAYNFQIAQLDDALKKCYIRNPVDGTVLTKFSEAKEVTMIGRPIYKIADLKNMELKVYISGAQLAGIKLHQKVEVLVDKDEKNNRKLEGTICWISQKAEFTPKIIQTKEERVKLVYAIKIRIINDGSLKIGMPGEVNFKLVNINSIN